MSRLIFSIFIILFISCHPKKEHNKYYPNGALRSKYYLIDEKIEGEMLDYSQNGKLVSKKMFSNGIQDGKTEYYYESGKLMEVQYYTKGERYLSDTLWFENGKIKDIIQFNHGKFNGSFTSYDSIGNIVFNAEFRNDSLIKVIKGLKDIK